MRGCPSRDPSPLAISAVCRQTSEVGAVCGKAARTVLCGGRSVMGVPTGIGQLQVTEPVEGMMPV